MIIGIDIDDTITKTTEQTDIFAKEYTEKILKREFSINFDTQKKLISIFTNEFLFIINLWFKLFRYMVK